ncbi:MAG TPA: hypothetical protein VNV25_09440 [Gemmatimonadaceae bacterium]|nr:hypothetical protein [Gemmatimonadaceae bacterium]
MIERLPRAQPGKTGGMASAGYIVQGIDGTRAYLKALDLASAWLSADPTRELQTLTTVFNFERDLLHHCRDQRLDRVVLALDHGQIAVDPMLYASIVPFLIFELGDGDIRSVLSFSEAFDTAWAVRALHHTATGLMQLHKNGIAHQDLKPSNVLLFDGGLDAKIGDLGRASRHGHNPPHDGLTIAGDLSYAPPELLYDAVDPDWRARRLGGDLYLLGSLAVSLFTGASMTGLIFSKLRPEHHWLVWKGSYASVLPFVRNAFDQVLLECATQFPAAVHDDLDRTVKQLCDPDPAIRGHPQERARRHGNPQSLERYVAALDLLARRSERGLKNAARRPQPTGARLPPQPSV